MKRAASLVVPSPFKCCTRCYSASSAFVPTHEEVHPALLEQLQGLVDNATNILVLTGAGISTESGIPDYRSEGVGLYARTDHKPIQHQEFMKFARVRQRYWARNFIGWPTFSAVRPNPSHLALTLWERAGRVQRIVTQNVDRLHHKAGSRDVVELHGCAYEVQCMNCQGAIPRHDFQNWLIDLNPTLHVDNVEMRPDADVALPQELVDRFRVPWCEKCQDPSKGFFKPNIVFFGDNVPKARVDQVFADLESSDCLLVIGSSLHVYSGYRFVAKARELGKPIAIINIGETRGDKHADLKINGKCSDVLSKICV